MSITPNEKIDKLFELIEQEVRKGFKSKHAIAERIAQEFGVSTRDLSTVFSFLLNQTLIDYIADRKLMAAYESLITSENFDVQTAIFLSGLGDQSAFNKRFKIRFEMTPMEAHKQKDISPLQVKMSWNALQTTEISMQTQKHASSNRSSKNTMFGISREKLGEIETMLELRDTYGFDELQCELVYYIFVTYNIPLNAAFRFVDEFKYADDTDDEELAELDDYPKLSRDEYIYSRVRESIDDPEMRYVYFQGDMDSIYTVYSVIDKLHNQGIKDVTELDIRIIDICAYDEIHVDYCIKAIKYFDSYSTEEYGDDAFNEYIESILCNIPIEIAFANISQLEGWDDYPSITEEEFLACMSEDIDGFDDTGYDADGGYNEADRHRKEHLDDFWSSDEIDDE